MTTHEDAAMPVEGHKTRRAALGALASLPALALLPTAAMAAPTSTDRLTDLIAVHDAALAAIQTVDKALDELTYPPDASVSFLEQEIRPIGGPGTLRGRLTRSVDLNFRMAVHTISMLSSEIGEAARVQLEAKRADSLAQIAAAYADYDEAERAVRKAEKVRDEALLAVCGHRCASPDELAIKLRHLAGGGFCLEEDASNALYKSLLPEGAL